MRAKGVFQPKSEEETDRIFKYAEFKDIYPEFDYLHDINKHIDPYPSNIMRFAAVQFINTTEVAVYSQYDGRKIPISVIEKLADERKLPNAIWQGTNNTHLLVDLSNDS